MVADISVGGVGIYVQRGEGPKVGERIRLEMRLATVDVTVDAEVRHVTKDGSVCGVQFVDVAEPAHRAISAYVGELIDRGSIS
jgi:c-di-GMP-binding flagellar brake protein YcgR